VSRFQIEGARAAVGLLETGVLAVLPALLVIALSSRFGGYPYPAMPALRSAALWALCGAVWFSAAFLWSTVLGAESTATVASMLTPIAWYTIARYTPLSRFPSLDVYGVMVGRTTEWWMPYHDWISGLMVGPMPWLTMALLAAAGSAILFVAGRVTAERSF